MKNLIILMFLLFAMGVRAEMPKYLEGATVTVTLKNGKTYEYKSEEMAVVKRENIDINAAANQELATVKQQIKDKKLVKNKKNRVYVLGGYGNTGSLDVSTNGSTYQTKHSKGAVGGIGYQRKLNEKVNVGVQVQTNGTTSLSIGTDF